MTKPVLTANKEASPVISRPIRAKETDRIQHSRMSSHQQSSMDRLKSDSGFHDDVTTDSVYDSGYNSNFLSSRSSETHSSNINSIDRMDERPPSPADIPTVVEAMTEIDSPPSVPSQSFGEVHSEEPSWLRKVDAFFAQKLGYSEHNIDNLVNNYLTPQELEQATKEMWDVGSDGLFGALVYAYHGDDCLTNFAIWIAPSHEVLNRANKHGQTLLHIATASCHPWTVRNIFTHGCDLKHKDAWGNNALHVAAMLGNTEVMDQLNRPATHDETRHSLMKVRFKSVRKPEDVNHINDQGMAPAHIAAEAGDHQTLQVLFEVAKADREIRRYSDGNSPAHLAVESGCLKTLEVCLRNGADSEVRNYRGQTPQQLALLCRNHAMVQLCQEYGASPNQLEFAETDQVESDCESIEDQMVNGYDGEEDLVPHIEALGNQMEDMSMC